LGFTFTLPPSKWEVEHAAGLFRSQVYQKLHEGDLPDTPIWQMLEQRFEINPDRFTSYHPNVAAMILASREEEQEVGELPSCPQITTPIVGLPLPATPGGPPGPQTAVPEPSSIVTFALAVVALYFWKGL